MTRFLIWCLAMFCVWITALPVLHVGLATLIVVVLTLINVVRKLGGQGVKHALILLLLAATALFVYHFWWYVKLAGAGVLLGLALRYVWVTYTLMRNRPLSQAGWMLFFRALQLAGILGLIWVLLTPVSLTLFGTVLLYWLCSNFRWREFRFRLF